MQIEQFLPRVVAPGNYLCVAWKSPKRGGMTHRFFPYTDIACAAGIIRWSAKQGNDVWFATASYREAMFDGADKAGRVKYSGERTQLNVEAIKAFWIDVDIRRDGDGKGANVYDTAQDVSLWLKQFLNATGMLGPNLVVNSGYGRHLYWILEDPMTREEWQPYAEALRVAVRAHGYKADIGRIADSASLMRIPETWNMKSGTGVPVTAQPALTGDYPNNLILDKLAPYLGQVPATPAQPPTQPSAQPVAPQLQSQPNPVGLANNQASALAGGAAAPILTAVANHRNLNANAQANMPAASAQREFKYIIPKCPQVQQSLNTGGASDDYPLWYLGFLSLAHHCLDGKQYAHDLSKGHVKYTQAGTDAALAQIAREKARKDHGPPRCASFDLYRPGVCPKCPHFNRIISPWVLGTPKDDGDLPPGYTRKNSQLQFMDKEAARLLPVVDGDVYGPLVEKLRDGYRISFVYEYAGTAFEVTARNSEALADPSLVGRHFVDQCVALKKPQFGGFGTFVAAWIDHIRAQKGERTESVPPFGYATTLEGDHVGVSIAGVLYRSDGTVEAAPLHDQFIKASYTQHGNYLDWRKAFDLVTDITLPGAIQRQAIIATAFGAPLMKFTGQRGLLVSAWSQGSGKGKTAALYVAQSVFAIPSTMNTLDSTTNASNKKMAVTQIMPSYWDEMRIEKGQTATLINRIFGIAQGQEKARLGPDLNVRSSDSWQTIATVASNTRLMDHVVGHANAGEAGAVRLFEFDVNTPPLSKTADAARVVDNTMRHYGHAGHQFIQWIAMNFLLADKFVKRASDKLIATVGELPEERMYIAGVAAIMAGASIATMYNIAPFDTKALFRFFCDVILDLRKGRTQNITASNGVVNAEEILTQFTSEFANERLITDRLGGVGNAQVMVTTPPRSGRVVYQIAEVDQIMLLDYNVFTTWARTLKGYNALEVETQFEQQLGAKRIKRGMGNGTIFATGKGKVIEVPLANITGYALTSQAVAVQAQAAINAAQQAAVNAAPTTVGQAPPP